MHRLFALPRFPDEAQTDTRRAYVAAWILLLTALLVGPVAAFLKPGDAVPWLLTTAAVAATSFVMIAIIRRDSLRRSRREEVSSKLEVQLRQAQKLESLGRMAGSVAHDFNNLLTVINGYSDLLLSRIHTSDPIHQDLQEIRNAGERAAGLMRQLVIVSRRQVVQPRALDLNAIVSGAKTTLQRLIGADIELTTVLQPALGCVMADPGQIHQVLTNLAANARDAMPRGGKLSIEAANMDLDERLAREHGGLSPGGYVLLTVSDTGTGVSEDAMAHIFEPFFTTKRAGSGTGLGLAVVYGIVKQNGGHIAVSSEAGRGSAFRIFLPRLPAPLSPSETSTADSVSARRTETGGHTVLIVDDEAAVRRLIRQALALCGFTILEAGGGEEALAVAAGYEGKIDVAIVDFVMPGLNGLDLALQMEREFPALKTLYVSSAIESIGIVSMLRHAPERVLLKPFTAQQLIQRVTALAQDRA